MENKLVFTSPSKTILDNELVGGVHYIQQSNPDGDLTIGCVYSSSVEFTTTYSGLYVGNSFVYYVKQRNDSSFRQMGTFYITEITNNNHGKYTITALDAISKLDQDVDVESGTLFALFSSVCSQCGIVGSVATGFINGNYVANVPDDVIFTGRQIIQYIAELNGSFAYVNSSGTLALRGYTYDGHSLDNSKYVSMEYSEVQCPWVSMVRFSQDKDDVGIYSGDLEYGEELRIYGNQLIDYDSLEASQTAVDNVLDAVSEYEHYSTGTIELLEDYSITCGEYIVVDVYGFYIMKKEITQSGVKLYSYGNAHRNVESVTGNSQLNNLKGKYNTLSRTVEETVSEVGSLGTTVNGHTTSITTLTQRADGLDITVASKVGNNEVISKINQSAEQITIQANKLNLTGMATFSQLQAVDQKAEAAQETADGSIASVDVQYYKSTSHTTTTGGSWSTTAPTWEEGYYIWSRNKNTLNDGTITYSTASCITGNTGTDGTGITSVTELYYVSSSSTAPSKPTSHVTTASTTAYNEWNKMCSTYNATYPYYYTCSEILYTTGSYGWSDVVANKGYESSNSTAANADTKATDAKSKTDGLATGTTTINGGCITTGIIQSSDENHQYYVNLDTGVATLKSADIQGGTININTDAETDDKIQLTYAPASGSQYQSRMRPHGFRTVEWENDGDVYYTDFYAGVIQQYYKPNGASDYRLVTQIDSLNGNGKIRFYDADGHISGRMMANGNDNMVILVSNTTTNWNQSGAVKTFYAYELKKYRYFVLVARSVGGRRVLGSTIIPNYTTYWGDAVSASVANPDTIANYAMMANNSSGYQALCAMQYIVNSVIPEGSKNYYLQVRSAGNADCQACVYGVY